jgi:hypothetical protein
MAIQNIYYIVNDKILFNPFLAQYELFKSKKPIKFYCKDDEYDKLDWTKEPELSMDALMDLHIINLRNKYERLILMWSGGTDSHTIYLTCKRNNIHLDEIIIKYSNELRREYPPQHVDWLIKNHYDPTTIITPWDEYDSENRKIAVANEDWIFRNIGDLFKFGGGATTTTTYEHCERNHGGHRWGIIAGHEKPHIETKDGFHWACQIDNYNKITMGHQNLESFFLEPMINLKQNHLALRFYKSPAVAKVRSSIQNRTRLTTGFSFEGKTVYALWCAAMGRYPELTDGASHAQKIANLHIRKTQIAPKTHYDSFDQAHGEPMLLKFLEKQNPVAVTYVKGLLNLRAEKDFFAYLNDNVFDVQDGVMSSKHIYSKHYKLGPI